MSFYDEIDHEEITAQQRALREEEESEVLAEAAEYGEPDVCLICNSPEYVVLGTMSHFEVRRCRHCGAESLVEIPKGDRHD